MRILRNIFISNTGKRKIFAIKRGGIVKNNSYIYETNEQIEENKRYFVVICYDIQNNKRRSKLVKCLERYALRVQYSVFEGELDKKKYNSLISSIDAFADTNDNIRIYKINGRGDVKIWGNVDKIKIDDIIII